MGQDKDVKNIEKITTLHIPRGHMRLAHLVKDGKNHIVFGYSNTFCEKPDWEGPVEDEETVSLFAIEFDTIMQAMAISESVMKIARRMIYEPNGGE